MPQIIARGDPLHFLLELDVGAILAANTSPSFTPGLPSALATEHVRVTRTDADGRRDALLPMLLQAPAFAESLWYARAAAGADGQFRVLPYAMHEVGGYGTFADFDRHCVIEFDIRRGFLNVARALAETDCGLYLRFAHGQMAQYRICMAIYQQLAEHEFELCGYFSILLPVQLRGGVQMAPASSTRHVAAPEQNRSAQHFLRQMIFLPMPLR